MNMTEKRRGELRDPDAGASKSRIFLRVQVPIGEAWDIEETKHALQNLSSGGALRLEPASAEPLAVILKIIEAPTVEVGCSIPSGNPQDDIREIQRVLRGLGVQTRFTEGRDAKS